MFREMRLKDQQLSQQETEDILKNATNGTLAINGDGPYPYSVPISFVLVGNKIYFHGAIEGQKHDLIKKDGHVSMSVVALDDVQPAKFTTFYKSAIVYGKARILTDDADIQKAMEATVEKYSPGKLEGGRKFIAAQKRNLCVYELEIEHITGKRSE